MVRGEDSTVVAGRKFYVVDEPEMPRWLADMARQADRISREMQPAVEMARSMEPHIAQATEAAATMAPALGRVNTATPCSYLAFAATPDATTEAFAAALILY